MMDCPFSIVGPKTVRESSKTLWASLDPTPLGSVEFMPTCSFYIF